MKLKWTKAALQDFEQAQAYIAQENPVAAQVMAKRVADATQVLLAQPKIGRMGNRSNTHEWVIKKTPYLIVYRIRPNALEIIRLWHSRQNWKR